MKQKKDKPVYEYPKSMDEAKKICRDCCKKIGVEVTFDDKYGNFCSEKNRCICAGERIECSRFSPWLYELLVFAVLHEIGHVLQGRNADTNTDKRNRFTREFHAWNLAMDYFVSMFRRNISVRQARYMMDCLQSYMPDYNNFLLTKNGIHETEVSFWCPLKSRVLR